MINCSNLASSRLLRQVANVCAFRLQSRLHLQMISLLRNIRRRNCRPRQGRCSCRNLSDWNFCMSLRSCLKICMMMCCCRNCCGRMNLFPNFCRKRNRCPNCAILSLNCLTACGIQERIPLPACLRNCSTALHMRRKSFRRTCRPERTSSLFRQTFSLPVKRCGQYRLRTSWLNFPPWTLFLQSSSPSLKSSGLI